MTATNVALPTPAPSAPQSLPGVKEFLVGDSGNGKTHVVRSLLGTGIQPLMLATEPGFRALSPCDNPACNICGPMGSANRAFPAIPYIFIPPSSAGLEILQEQAKNVMTKDQAALSRIVDKQRENDFNAMKQFYDALGAFKASDGMNYGAIEQWGTDRCLVVDGLSSLGDMAMDMYVGRRPLYDKPDYQIAQRVLKAAVMYLTMKVRAHVILIAHIGRGEDSLEGRNKITANTVGQKLAPELPRFFDDMIHAEREGAVFTWSTATTGAIAKARNLPYKTGMQPSFKPVVESWKKAGGILIPSQPATPY